MINSGGKKKSNQKDFLVWGHEKRQKNRGKKKTQKKSDPCNYEGNFQKLKT